MGAQLGTKGAIAEINMTPLIDIVLVVLIIMMVNIPIQVEEMGVRLPSTSDVTPPPPDMPTEQLVVAIYEDGTLALNRRLMTEDVLFYEVTRRLRPMDKKNVFIDADGAVPYGRVVALMDMAREAGASRVGLAKMKPQGPLPVTSVAPGSLPRGVDVGLATVIGALSQRMADEAIAPLKPYFMGCYEQALGRNPALSGRVMLRATVGPAGEQLDPPKVSTSNHGDASLDRCIEAVATERLTFPALGEGNTAVAQYPILFSPG